MDEVRSVEGRESAGVCGGGNGALHDVPIDTACM